MHTFRNSFSLGSGHAGPRRLLAWIAVASLLTIGSVSFVGAAASAAPTAKKPSGDPIKLLVIYDQSPELVDGANAAAAAINRAGGIGDRPLKVSGCNTKSDPNTARSCGERAASDGVAAVVGSLTPLSDQYMSILAENKIPSVGNLPVNTADFTSPASFPIDGGLVTISAGLADALYRDGAKRQSIARVDLALASAIQTFANQGLAPHDAKIVSDISIPQGAPDMSAYVASATADDVDGTLVGLFGQDATNFIVALRQQAPDVTPGLVSTDLDNLIKALGSDSDGMLVTSALLPNTSKAKAVRQYKADLRAIGVKDPGGYRKNAYAAVEVFAAVAKGLPDVNAPAVFDALPGVTDLDIGLMPPIQFATGGVGGLPRIFNPCTMYLKVKNEKQVPFVKDFVNPFTGETCPMKGAGGA